MVVYCKYSVNCTLAINSWLAYTDNDGKPIFKTALLKGKSLPATFLPHLLKDLNLDLVFNKLRYFANRFQESDCQLLSYHCISL